MTRVVPAAESQGLEPIADAFSRTARRYDEFAQDHPHLARMRAKVYAHVEAVIPSGGNVLELNAGTGTDAVELARRGYRVHATDIAPGMLERLQDKVDHLAPRGSVTVEARSYFDLDGVPGAPFDAVFSDLGGLNCTPDLRPVMRGIDRVLRPGGTVVLVLMPRICLWELAMVFTGQPTLAFRRLSRHGTIAHLEGRVFPVYYFDPRQAIDALGPDYDVIGLEGLSVITPTAESKNLAKRHRSLYRALCWADDRVARTPPMSGWGDFYILSARRRVEGATRPSPPGRRERARRADRPHPGDVP